MKTSEFSEKFKMAQDKTERIAVQINKNGIEKFKKEISSLFGDSPFALEMNAKLDFCLNISYDNNSQYSESKERSTKVKSLLKKLNLENPQDIANLTKMQFLLLPGVGPKTLEYVKKNYLTPSNLDYKSK